MKNKIFATKAVHYRVHFNEKYIFFALASVAVFLVALICIFIFAGGLPSMLKIGLIKFIFGAKWKPELDLYGILPMIQASFVVTLGALCLSCPLGILTAVFLGRFCKNKIKTVFVSLVDLLAAIPSVVFGFFGLMVIVPFISSFAGGSGACVFCAILVLSLMILPTIISITQSTLEALPDTYMQANLALGACREHGVFFAELVAAKNAIIAGVVLALGRAIGETMAVIMVSGNQPIMLRGLFRGARTLTANIALEMGYATGLHRGALLATSVVLFTIILLLNAFLMLLNRDKSK